MEMNDVLSAMRKLCKHPLFDVYDNSFRAEPGQLMKWFNVPMDTDIINLNLKASEDQLRKGWSIMREEGLIPS